MRLLLFLLWLHQAFGVYPTSTLEWDFMIATGQDAADVHGKITLRKGSTLPALNSTAVWGYPSITALGWSFEGEEIACMGPNSNTNMGSTFSTHFWIYIYNLEQEQVLFCREWLEDETNITLNSQRYCLMIKYGQLVWMWNPSNVTSHRKDYTKWDVYNYMFQHLDLYVKYGWTYFAVNFQTNTANTNHKVWGYMATSDQGRQVSNTFTIPGPLIDDNKFITGLGMMVIHDQVTLTYERRYGLKALVNNWALFKNKILERWHAMDYFGFQCTNYGPIGRMVDQPKCLEEFESNLLHYWDLSPFRWYRPIYDYGRISSTIPLNTVMTNQALFTHNNGMWFTGDRWLTPSLSQWNVSSWTVDVWFKFYDRVNGTLIENNHTFPVQWSLWFFPPNNVTFQLNMNTINTTFTFNEATDYNKWMFVQAGTNKQDAESRIGVKMNDEPTACNFVATYYNDTSNVGNIRIGYGFYGYIRKIKIYDWFKTEPSLLLNYKVAPEGYKFHWTQSDGDIGDIDYNYTGYTDGSERNMWDYDCKTGDSRCYTCSGNDQWRGFSCDYPLYDFHERGTAGPEQCGDGKLLGDFECDDGNIVSDDGGSSDGKLEADFACIDGTPTSSTACFEIGGNGRHINYEGDDGNTLDGDGCNSTGYIETGYTCTQGGRHEKDVCWELCGDGVTLDGEILPELNNYEGDDGNNIDGDGGSSVCRIETGWTCSGGNETTASTGTEICGDGIRTFDLGDDGNTDDGDGGSSTCAVESGWMCSSIDIPSVGWKTTSPSIVETYYDESLIGLTFNETVILDSDWTEEDWRVNITGPMTPYNLTWKFLSADILMVPIQNLSVWFEYTIYDTQLFGNGTEKLTIYFDDLQVMNSYSYNFPIMNSSVDFALYPKESNVECGIFSFMVTVMGVAGFIIVVGILGLLVGHSMVIPWQVINILQFVHFIPFMMIYAPSGVVNFGENFGVFNTELGAVGATLIQSLFPKSNYYNVLDYKFIRGGYESTAFLWNAADILTMWLLCYLAIPILLFLNFMFPRVEIIGIIYSRFRKGFAYVLILLTYLRTSFGVILNLSHADFSNGVAGFSTMLALGFGCLIVAFPPYEAYNAIVYYREIRQGKRPTYFRLNVLFFDFGVVSSWQFFYYWQLFLRRFILALMVVAWPRDEFLTLTWSTIMHIFSMLYLSYIKPFNSHVRNFSALFTEIGLVSLHAVCFGFAQASPDLGAKHFKEYGFYFGLILLIVILVNLILTAVDSWTPLQKLGIVTNILEEKVIDENENRIVEDFSDTDENSSSMTEMEVSLPSRDGDYDAQKEKERIEFVDTKKPKESEKVVTKKRASTPPKNSEALVPQFGPKLGLKNVVDPQMTAPIVNPKLGTPLQIGAAGQGTLAGTNTAKGLPGIAGSATPGGLPGSSTPSKVFTASISPEALAGPSGGVSPAKGGQPSSLFDPYKSAPFGKQSTSLGQSSPFRKESTAFGKQPTPILGRDEEEKRFGGRSDPKILTPNIGTGFEAGDLSKALNRSDSD